MSSAEVLLTVISTVVGALIGLATSHYYFRRGLSAGPQMVISLTEQARIEPATVGVKVEMKVGPIEVTNLVVLEVAVSNPGDKNLDVKDAEGFTALTIAEREDHDAVVKFLQLCRPSKTADAS